MKKSHRTVHSENEVRCHIVSDSQIDDAILSVAQVSWRKVAMIVSMVAKSLGSDFPDVDEGYHLVAKRIEVLVDDGRLVAQGDVTLWRFSEVRLPS
jgi:hypothetical protein